MTTKNVVKKTSRIKQILAHSSCVMVLLTLTCQKEDDIGTVRYGGLPDRGPYYSDIGVVKESIGR